MLNLTPYPTISFSKQVSIKFPNGFDGPLGNFFFDFDPEITRSKLTGICFVPNTLNSGPNSITVETAKYIYITLVDHNNERIVDNLPLNALYTLNSSGNIILRRFSNRISLENSFVTINGTLESGENIYFTVYVNPNI
jgi:hypothetical protein